MEIDQWYTEASSLPFASIRKIYDQALALTADNFPKWLNLYVVNDKLLFWEPTLYNKFLICYYN